MSLLEIVKPAAQRRIQFDDNFRQTIPARALGPHPDAIVHGLKTLAPHPASPHFEVIAQKVKPCHHCRQSPTWVFSALRLRPLTSTQAFTSASAAWASSALRHNTTKSSAYRTIR